MPKNMLIFSLGVVRILDLVGCGFCSLRGLHRPNFNNIVRYTRLSYWGFSKFSTPVFQEGGGWNRSPDFSELEDLLYKFKKDIGQSLLIHSLFRNQNSSKGNWGPKSKPNFRFSNPLLWEGWDRGRHVLANCFKVQSSRYWECLSTGWVKVGLTLRSRALIIHVHRTILSDDGTWIWGTAWRWRVLGFWRGTGRNKREEMSYWLPRFVCLSVCLSASMCGGMCNDRS